MRGRSPSDLHAAIVNASRAIRTFVMNLAVATAAARKNQMRPVRTCRARRVGALEEERNPRRVRRIPSVGRSWWARSTPWSARLAEHHAGLEFIASAFVCRKSAEALLPRSVAAAVLVLRDGRPRRMVRADDREAALSADHDCTRDLRAWLRKVKSGRVGLAHRGSAWCFRGGHGGARAVPAKGRMQRAERQGLGASFEQSAEMHGATVRRHGTACADPPRSVAVSASRTGFEHARAISPTRRTRWRRRCPGAGSCARGRCAPRSQAPHGTGGRPRRAASPRCAGS